MIEPVVDLTRAYELGDRVVLADVRWYLDGRDGRAAYDRGHLPGAIFVDLDRVLARHGRPDEGRHPLPEPSVFAAGMAGLGVGDEDIVIAYDDAGGVVAARLVWMLRATGRDAALLDGGFGAYEGRLSTDVPERPAAVFRTRAWPTERLAGIDAASDESSVVVDARDATRFRGDAEPVDPRAGHIPGARNLPCRDNVDSGGRFLPVEVLRARFEAIGAGDDMISYCGSGVTACHNLIALEHAGLGVGRLYPGSWSAYSNTERPVATGAQSIRRASSARPGSSPS